MRSPLRSRWSLVALLVFTVLGVAGWYQAQAPSSSEVPAPTIRVTTHLVLVDAVVTDKQGKPVTGLHPEDFVLEENGKVQKISSFVTPEQNNPGPPPALPPGIYSNKAEYRSPGGPLTVLLLDALNTPFRDQAYARLQMLKFVQETFKPNDRMAVFTLTGGLTEIQDFTSDPQILYAALKRFRPESQQFVNEAVPGVTGPGAITDPGVLPVTSGLGAQTLANTSAANVAAQSVATAEAALHAFENAQSQYVLEQRTAITLNALSSLGRMLGGLPGRKSIIWVTGSLPFTLVPEERSMSDAELEEALPNIQIHTVDQHAAGNYAATTRAAHAEEIREISARLSSAQIAVYPVDARGLTLSNDEDAQETMKEVASQTGGRAYINQNEIHLGVERALEDDTADYTLGYYPENKKYDGKYRNIKLKVKRDGMEVVARRGYYAIDPTQIKGYNPEAEVASAFRDVAPSTMVAFTARVVPPAQNHKAKGKVGVDFLVDAHSLSAEDQSGNKKLNVAFFATALSPDGKILVNRSMKVDQAFNAQIYEQILQHGLLLHMDVEPPPGNIPLRLAVQDNRTGMVGTIIAPANP